MVLSRYSQGALVVLSWYSQGNLQRVHSSVKQLVFVMEKVNDLWEI
jgi:hypothetical protein